MRLRTRVMAKPRDSRGMWRTALVLVVWTVLAGCGGAYGSAARSSVIMQAQREHACSTVTVESVDDYGYWLDVCGDLRYYEGRRAPFVEDTNRTVPHSVRFTGGGSDRVHVRGYYRRDGTYVRPHTRRRPH